VSIIIAFFVYLVLDLVFIMAIKRIFIFLTIAFISSASHLFAQSTAINFSDPSSILANVSEGVSVPNVFTPNYDGVNDAFYIANKGITEYSLKIFDRYGILEFETVSPNIAWDGTTPSGLPVITGTYFYVLVAKSSGSDYSQMGKIMLLR